MDLLEKVHEKNDKIKHKCIKHVYPVSKIHAWTSVLTNKDLFLSTKSKQSQVNQEAVTNDVVAQAHLESKGVQLFLWADTEDRAGRFNK